MWGMIRAQLQHAGLNKNKKLKGKLWAECANMTTQLINILVDDNKAECAYEKFYGKMPTWCQSQKLKAFGQMCVVTWHNKIKGKLEDHGGLMIMVGYADDSTPVTY